MSLIPINQLENGKRGWVLIYTPRSGSTPIARAIASSLGKCQGIVYLEEIFNQDFVGIQFIEGRFKVDLSAWSSAGGGLRQRQRMGKLVVKKRMSWLRKSREKHFFKMNPLQVNKRDLNWILKNYNVIFLERGDLYGQLLSFLISWKSGQWYLEGGVKVADASISALIEEFIVFLQMIMRYEDIKKRFWQSTVLLYEDFASLGSDTFLERLGMRPASIYQLPTVQSKNRRQKEKKIKNLSEVRRWFELSILPALRARRS